MRAATKAEEDRFLDRVLDMRAIQRAPRFTRESPAADATEVRMTSEGIVITVPDFQVSGSLSVTPAVATEEREASAKPREVPM